MDVRIRPPMRIWIPSTQSSSDCDQPFSSCVCEYTSASTTRPVTSAIAAWKSETKKFTRYCSSLSTPSLKKSQLTRTAFTSTPHRRIPANRVAPGDAEHREPDEDPEELRHQAADELDVRVVADEGLDREVERPLEGKEARNLLHPVGHERHRDEAAREQELERHPEVEDRSAPGRPEAEHPERLLEHRPDEVRAPDRDREGHDLLRVRAQRRIEEERERDREGNPQHDHDDLPAGEVGDVVVERKNGPQQVAVQLALADAVLPERRAEDDVHVPDEGPDDLVGREVARAQAVHRAALLIRDRRPDDEVDHRLGDHAEHVEVVRGPVLELLRDGRPRGRHIEVDHRPETSRLLLGSDLRYDGHSGRSWAKTSSITSSMGGSSTFRSSTCSSVSNRAVTLEVSAFGTRSVIQSPSVWMISP